MVKKINEDEVAIKSLLNRGCRQGRVSEMLSIKNKKLVGGLTKK